MSCWKILSFDPGLSTSGWNFSEYDTDKKIMIVRAYGMLYPNKEISTVKYRDECTKYGARIMTLYSLQLNVKELMDTYKPDFVVSEDAFYNPCRPTAYCALVQWITTVAVVLFSEYNTTLFRLAPKIAKHVVSGFGGAAKLGVQHAILHRNDIKFNPKVDMSRLTEHICDSVGIGYTFIQEILPSLLEIWSMFNVKQKVQTDK